MTIRIAFVFMAVSCGPGNGTVDAPVPISEARGSTPTAPTITPNEAPTPAPTVAPCPLGMLQTSVSCVDQTPRIYWPGVGFAQGIAHDAANESCRNRGARLCTQPEREAACDLVDVGAFCAPLRETGTLEWGSDPVCPIYRVLVSECCGAAPAVCEVDLDRHLSFHCCVDRLR